MFSIASSRATAGGPRTAVVNYSRLGLVLLVSTSGAGSAELPTSNETSADAESDAALIERPWALHDGKHWQLVSPVSEDPELTDRLESTRGHCPAGMVAVQGLRKLDPAPFALENMQKLTCTHWITTIFPERCAVFDQASWRELLAPVTSAPTRFCIDRYEFPNVKGQYPWVFVTWDEAAAFCARQEKRLCTEDEWTFACEGQEALPYPYGFVRSEKACVIDKPYRTYEEREFADRAGEKTLLALDRIFQGEPSGSRATCRSPFGVYDLTGNVDEWTYGTIAERNRSVLKGGYWGPVRARCRPSTRVHGEGFAYYQQGFRCCSDWPMR